MVDANDPAALARWWASVLDWTIPIEEPDEVVIADDKTFPGIVFVPGNEFCVLRAREGGV